MTTAYSQPDFRQHKLLYNIQLGRRYWWQARRAGPQFRSAHLPPGHAYGNIRLVFRSFPPARYRTHYPARAAPRAIDSIRPSRCAAGTRLNIKHAFIFLGASAYGVRHVARPTSHLRYLINDKLSERTLKLARTPFGGTPVERYFCATPELDNYASRVERPMAAKTRERRDELSRDIYEIRTKIDPVVASNESPWRAALYNGRVRIDRGSGRIDFQNVENSTQSMTYRRVTRLVLPLLRSTNKFIVWHVNGCVRAKKLQRLVKKKYWMNRRNDGAV